MFVYLDIYLSLAYWLICNTYIMPKTDVYNTSAKKTGQVSLPDEIFAAPVNEELIAQSVRVYLANQRQAHAKTKTRGEVTGSTRKIYRQKGTGRARHGDRYAPIFVGGGIAHGPTGEENYQLKMTRKMRRLALFSALTDKLRAKQIIVIQGLEKVKPKTKEMSKILTKLTERKPESQKLLLVLPKVMENVIRGARNIKGVKVTLAKQLHPYQILNRDKLILTKPALKVLKETFLKKKG